MCDWSIGVHKGFLDREFYILFHKVPLEDKWIKILNLSNPKNNPQAKSCYIGTIGVVKQVNMDGSFHLRINGDGGWLIVHKDKKLEFEYIKNLNG